MRTPCESDTSAKVRCIRPQGSNIATGHVSKTAGIIFGGCDYDRVGRRHAVRSVLLPILCRSGTQPTVLPPPASFLTFDYRASAGSIFRQNLQRPILICQSF